jgi:tRNA pseudouridine65 synthase
VHTVHRLDRATSGVLLVAKNKCAAKHLTEQFFAHSIEKTYLCVVCVYAPQGGVIDHPLKYQPDKIAELFASIAKVEYPIGVAKWPAVRYSMVKLSQRLVENTNYGVILGMFSVLSSGVLTTAKGGIINYLENI